MKKMPAFAVALVVTLVASLGSATSASAVGSEFFGVNVSNFTTNDSDWNAVGNSGAHVMRAAIQWNIIQNKAVEEGKTWRDNSPWVNTYDQWIELAAKHNVKFHAILYARKSNATGQEHQFYTSSDAEWGEWFEFVWTAVARYGYGGSFWAAHPSLPYRPIRIWEVWNEPNLPLNNPGEVKSAVKYAQFFNPTANTIRNAQSSVRKAGEPEDTRVVVGGLYQQAHVNEKVVGNYFAELKNANPTLSTEFHAKYDGVGVHPYSFTGNEAEKIAGVQNNVNLARTAVNEYGGVGKTLWVSELGWPTGTEAPPSGSTSSEEEQGNLVGSVFGWLAGVAESKNIKFANYYFYQDTGGAGWDRHCGLRRQDGFFRKAWYRFQEVAGAPRWPRTTIAFASTTNQLSSINFAEFKNWTQGMLSGTSPSVAQLTNAGYEMAFQSNGGQLISVGAGGSTNWGQGMSAGTSPDITALPGGGYQMAFQSNGNQLISIGTDGPNNWGQGMKPNTSPAIAALSGGGFQMAFQANTGNLFHIGTTGGSNTGLGMMAGTSPDITALANNGFEMAFQANNGQLWFAGSAGNSNTGLGMMAGTSPSITTLSGGGYEAAFQANNGELWTAGSAGNKNWGQGMAAGTSPSITALPGGGNEVAFRANSGELITIGTAGGTNWGKTTASGTSPSITTG